MSEVCEMLNEMVELKKEHAPTFKGFAGVVRDNVNVYLVE